MSRSEDISPNITVTCSETALSSIRVAQISFKIKGELVFKNHLGEYAQFVSDLNLDLRNCELGRRKKIT